VTQRPPVSYLGRFILPLVLLAAALAAWFTADQLGTTDRQTAAPTSSSADLAAPLFTVRRVPEFATSTQQTEATAAALAALPAEPGGLSCVSILVDGEPILQVGNDRSLVPAYAQLLITAHVAIDVLGPEFTYETVVMAEALPDDNGTIARRVYVIGGGDPVLMSRNYALGFRPPLTTYTSFEALSQSVVDAGVVQINGGFVAVERRYDEQRVVPGWPDQLSVDGIVGPLSALQLDDAFTERAAANLGVAVAAEEPAQHMIDRMVLELTDQGVTVFGTHRLLGADEELPSLVPVTRISSPPLGDIVFQMLAVNDASAAELILKELGFNAGDSGSTQAGGQVVQSVLQQQGVELPVAFRDGSGLDPFGGTSCSQLAQTADTIPDDHRTLEFLPAHNLPGVFDGRLVDVAVEADLRLVGGVQGDASGFVARTVDQGRRVTIASIINRAGGPTAADLDYQQALVEMVDGLRPAISVEALSLDG